MAAGLYSNGYCHESSSAAYQQWCFSVDAGNTFSSCQIVAGTPEISFVNSSGTTITASYTPTLAACDTDIHNLNPIPMGFAISGAIVLTWVGFWSFNMIRNTLKGD